MGVAFGTSFQNFQLLIYGVFSYVLPVMVAIFNLPLSAMSESFHTAVLLDPGNVDVAFEILLLSSIEAEISRLFHIYYTFGHL